MNTHNTSRFRPVALALAMGAFALTLPLSAQALTITQFSSQRTDDNISVNDSTAAGGSVTSSGGAGTSSANFGSFQKFDSANGVLTGVTATLATTGGTLSQSTTDNNAGVEGSSSLNAAWKLFGAMSAPAVVASFPSTTNVAATGSFAPLVQAITALDSLVGTGSVSGASSVDYTVTADKSKPGGGTRSVIASYDRGSGDNTRQTLTYEYLLHAAPSFDGGVTPTLTLHLDFDSLGSIFVGDTPSLGFSLFNLAGDRVGLDLDLIAPISGAGAFALDPSLLPFDALGAGLSRSYTALLDTSSAGFFSAIYQLSFSDAAVGAAASRWSYENAPTLYQLTLNLSGTVRERDVGGVPDTGGDTAQITLNSVPEPTSLALLGLGLFGLGAMRRRARA